MSRRIAAKKGQLGGFVDKWTDVPVDVLHEVCHLAVQKPDVFADHLAVSELDMTEKPKTDIPADTVRHIMHIWILRRGSKATLDWLLQALDKMKLLGALEGILDQQLRDLEIH